MIMGPDGSYPTSLGGRESGIKEAMSRGQHASPIHHSPGSLFAWTVLPAKKEGKSYRGLGSVPKGAAVWPCFSEGE